MIPLEWVMQMAMRTTMRRLAVTTPLPCSRNRVRRLTNHALPSLIPLAEGHSTFCIWNDCCCCFGFSFKKIFNKLCFGIVLAVHDHSVSVSFCWMRFVCGVSVLSQSSTMYLFAFF